MYESAYPPVAIIVPVLARPHRVAPLLHSVLTSTPEPHMVLFVADADDTDELAAVRDGMRGYPPTETTVADLLVVEPGLSYGTKINRGYRAIWHPFVFTGADDLDFHAGWYPPAVGLMLPNPRIGVVGTVDLCNDRTRTGRTSTHSLVRRSYIEQQSGVADAPDSIYCELYSHEYVDDELVRTAKKRRAYAHSYESVVEHLHPNVGKAEMDATYEKGRERTDENRRIFQSRRRLWS